MKNKKKQIKNNNLDSSYDSFKYSLQKENKNKINNGFKNNFHKNDNEKYNYPNIFRNKMNLNKSNYTNDDKNTYINKNFKNNPRIKTNKSNNYNSKESFYKSKNTPIKRVCNTPDRNIKYNLGFTPNKNNISLLKLNNRNFKEINKYKKDQKLFFERRKQKYNYSINERKKALTPDRIKPKNLDNSKKIREYENSKYFNYNQKRLGTNFSKSFCDSNYNYTKSSADNYNLFYDSSSSYYKRNDNKRKKTSDKLSTNYNNTKYSIKNSRGTKLSILNNSQIKFSRSFCSKKERNGKNSYDLRNSNGKKYLLSNSQINSDKKHFNNINQSKILLNSKSTNSNCIKRNIFKSDDIHEKNYKYRNFKKYKYNNLSFESSKSNNQKNDYNLSIKHPFNNINTYPKKNENYFSSNYENYNNKNEMTFSQKKANKDLGKFDYLNNKFNNINSNSFFEKNQQKLNKVHSNIKNNKFIGITNFMTKSSTNTYDEINSSNSIISKKNTNLDSIEEIHFNFVNVVQSSRNLMKLENKIGEKILNNNQNSSVIFVEERDIE